MPRSSRISRRSTAQSRFSAFFHGRSVVVPSAVYTRKAVPEAPIRTPIFDRYTTSGSRSRSPTSTRSIIDPSSSPLSCAESLPSGAFPGFEGAAGRSDMAYILPTGPSEDHQHAARVVKFSRYRRAWRRPKKVEKGKRHLCFPYVKDPKIRGKVIGSLISGLALVIILTICTSLFLRLPSSLHRLTTKSPHRPRHRNHLRNHPGVPHPPNPPHLDPHDHLLPLHNPPLHALPFLQNPPQQPQPHCA